MVRRILHEGLHERMLQSQLSKCSHQTVHLDSSFLQQEINSRWLLRLLSRIHLLYSSLGLSDLDGLFQPVDLSSRICTHVFCNLVCHNNNNLVLCGTWIELVISNDHLFHGSYSFLYYQQYFLRTGCRRLFPSVLILHLVRNL